MKSKLWGEGNSVPSFLCKEITWGFYGKSIRTSREVKHKVCGVTGSKRQKKISGEISKVHMIKQSVALLRLWLVQTLQSWPVTTSTDSVFTDLISNSRWASFQVRSFYQTIRMLWYNQSIVLSRANVLAYQECLCIQTKTS